MDRAITFWESVLSSRITSRNKDRWANFASDGVYLGLYRPAYDNAVCKWGDNVMLVLRSIDISGDHTRISGLGAKPTPIEKAGNEYSYFHFIDTEGNFIEVAEYSRN